MDIQWPILLAFTKPTLTFLGAAAWPLSAAFIAMRFRDPISSAIARARRVSAFGIEADMPTIQQPVALTSSDELLDPDRLATVSPEPPFDVLLAPIESHFLSSIEYEPLKPEQKLKWAVRMAAVQAMLARHEQHYRLIYGSQLALLRHLNVAIVAPIQNARYFFDTFGTKPPPTPAYTFENWFAFLLGGNDIEKFVGPDGAEMLRLTPMGKAFLVWATEQSVVEQKPF